MANDLSARMRMARLMGGGGGDSDGIRPVRRTSGTAVSDSEGGKVLVQLSDGDPIEVPTSVAVKAGQTVSLLVSGGVATAVGVAGWGDSMQKQVDETKAEVDDHEKLIADVKKDVADYKASAEATYATKTEVDDKTGAITKTLEADYKTWADTEYNINDNYVGIADFNDTISGAEQFVAQTYAEKTELTEAVNSLTSTMTSNYSAFTDYKSSNDSAVAAAKKAGTDAQANLDDYKTSNDAEIASMKTTYATKSELESTDTELSGKVSDALTTAKSYTDSSITTEVTNRDAAIKAKADSISLEVSKTYTKAETFSAYQNDADQRIATANKAGTDAQANLDDYKNTVAETYATKASLKVQEDRITTEVGAREKTDSTVANLSTKVDQTATSLSTEVAARKQTDTNLSALSTKVTQTADGLTTEISDRKQAVSDAQAAAVNSANSATDAKLGNYTKTADLANTAAVKDAKKAGTDAQEAAGKAQSTANGAAETANATATLIRQYSGGVLVAKTGAAVGALVNANGSFDVVALTWSGGVPSVSGTLSSFDADSATIGTAATPGASVDLLGGAARFYVKQWVERDDGSREVRINASGNGSVIVIGPEDEATNGGLIIRSDSGIPKLITDDDPYPTDAAIATQWPLLVQDGMSIGGKAVKWQSAAVTLNTSSSLLGSHSASCLTNPGLGLAYLAIDMSFDSPGWQPGTSTWLFRLPSGLRPSATKRLYNLIQIYINGRWGAHVDVHPDGYCYPTWGWQATNIMCNMVFPLALLGEVLK